MSALLSLIVAVPAYDDPGAAIDGLRHPDVEVVAVTDRRLSTWPGVRVVDPGPDAIARAARAATTPAVAVADPFGLLDRSLTRRVASRLVDERGRHQVVYTDERVAGVEVLKPDWSPTFFAHHHYTGRLTVVPTELLRAAGDDRSFATAAAQHAFLRAAAAAGVPFHHEPVIAYERLFADPAPVAPPRAPSPAVRQSVSVLLPTAGTRVRDRREPASLALRALRSIELASRDLDCEVVLSIGPEMDRRSLDEILSEFGAMVRLVRDDGPFNFSRRMNLAAARSDGDVLLWMNDDVERHADDTWLRRLVARAAEDEVGIAAPKLLYPDESVQAVGIRFPGGLPKHVGVGAGCFEAGPLRSFVTPREQAAVTGAVLASRRHVYDTVGGLSEDLAVNFNDVDYCLKVRSAGWSIVVDPEALLVHHESATRIAGAPSPEIAELQRRWPTVADPYWPWDDEFDNFPGRTLRHG